MAEDAQRIVVIVEWTETYDRSATVPIHLGELREWAGDVPITGELVKEFLKAGPDDKAWHPSTLPTFSEWIDVRIDSVKVPAATWHRSPS